MLRSVLVADADPLMRRLIVEALALKGFETFEAANGREAIAFLTGVLVEVAIIDVLLEFNGSNVFDTVADLANAHRANVIAIGSADMARRAGVAARHVGYFIERGQAPEQEILFVINAFLMGFRSITTSPSDPRAKAP